MTLADAKQLSQLIDRHFLLDRALIVGHDVRGRHQEGTEDAHQTASASAAFWLRVEDDGTVRREQLNVRSRGDAERLRCNRQVTVRVPQHVGVDRSLRQGGTGGDLQMASVEGLDECRASVGRDTAVDGRERDAVGWIAVRRDELRGTEREDAKHNVVGLEHDVVIKGHEADVVDRVKDHTGNGALTASVRDFDVGRGDELDTLIDVGNLGASRSDEYHSLVGIQDYVARATSIRTQRNITIIRS